MYKILAVGKDMANLISLDWDRIYNFYVNVLVHK